MTKTIIVLYEKYSGQYKALIREEADVLTYKDDEPIEDFIRQIKGKLADRNIIICDEEGGVPYCCALIASADTDTTIISSLKKEQITEAIRS